MNVKFQVFTLALLVFSLGAVACANAQGGGGPPPPLTVTLNGPGGGLQPPGVTFGLQAIVTCNAATSWNAYSADIYATGSNTQKGHFLFSGLAKTGVHTFYYMYQSPVNWSWMSVGYDNATPAQNNDWSGWVGPI